MQLISLIAPTLFVVAVAAAPNKLVRKEEGPGWKTNGGNFCEECLDYPDGSWVALWEHENSSGRCACVEAENHCFDLGPIGFGAMTSSFQYTQKGPGCALFATNDCTGETYGTHLWAWRGQRFMDNGWNDKVNSVICYT